jgi:hemoglobin
VKHKNFTLHMPIFVLILTLTAGVALAQPKEQTLYQRLGGYDAIAAVTDDFITRLATDPTQTKFFTGFSADSKQRIRQHIVDFVCQATGGPCVYKGRDLKTAHAGIGIAEADWQTSVKLLTASLDKFKVPEKEKTEFLNLVSSVKKDIVEK